MTIQGRECPRCGKIRSPFHSGCDCGKQSTNTYQQPIPSTGGRNVTICYLCGGMVIDGMHHICASVTSCGDNFK